MYTWIILGLATILRLVYLNQSLWLDESIEALALMGRMGPILTYALADYQPPLYHLIGYAFTQLLGYSETVLRLPSLLAGILTVYFVVKIGELIGNKKIGIIVGLLAATNPLLIYYSQEGRTYAMTAFFVTASFYYFIKLLNTKVWSLESKVSYLIFTILFLWTSYLAWFVILAQGLYALWKKRFDLVFIQLLSALTLVFWLPSLISSLALGQSTLGGSPQWGRVVGGLSWKSLPLTWVKFVIGRISFDNKMLYGLIVMIIGLFHLFSLKMVEYKKNLVLLVWLIPPVLLGLIAAGFLPIYQYFRVLFVLPAYLLLLAIGLSKLHRNFTYLIITSQIIFLAIFWFSPRFHREDWRQLVHDLPREVVVALPSRAQSAPLRYYGWDQPIIEPSHERFEGSQIYYIRYAEDLFDTARLGQANLLNSGYTITYQRYYPGIQVDVYEK